MHKIDIYLYMLYMAKRIQYLEGENKKLKDIIVKSVEKEYQEECKKIESALNRTISPEEIEKTMNMIENMKNIKTIEKTQQKGRLNMTDNVRELQKEATYIKDIFMTR